MLEIAQRRLPDARFVQDCWSSADGTIAVDRMQRRLREVPIVLGKLQLILDHFEAGSWRS